uniref:Putative secreted protein n=1 Tax=Ixodes ricinus TaxID=34613 RepID=A0A6B0UGT7_IXORI
MSACSPPSLTSSLCVASSLTGWPFRSQVTSGKGRPVTRTSKRTILPSVTSWSWGIFTKLGFRVRDVSVVTQLAGSGCRGSSALGMASMTRCAEQATRPCEFSARAV